MAKVKTTVYVEKDLLTEARVLAVREGRKDYEAFEDALAAHLGMAAVKRPWERSELSEDQALRMAYDELHRAG